MTDTERHDAWSAGDSYKAYMGRWSRRVARGFLGWLNAAEDLDWLEVGCGTGALSSEILLRCRPRSVLGVEPSQGFLTEARKRVPDKRAEFQIGEAQALPLEDGSKDVAASALVLNFVPDKQKALEEMVRVTRPGGIVCFYVWDYPGGGVEFVQAFWDAAVELNRDAQDLSEDKRFSECTENDLAESARSPGLVEVETKAIETSTIFTSFEDFWQPFTLGAGPAPGYCVNLEPGARGKLRNTLQNRLPVNEDGSISMKVRAWGVKASTRQ